MKGISDFDMETAMSKLNNDISSESARSTAARSTPSASHELIAVVAFSAIGLLTSLLIGLLFPESPAAFLVEVP
jgi:hypothetical protein